jgi:hypothetical protein
MSRFSLTGSAFFFSILEIIFASSSSANDL